MTGEARLVIALTASVLLDREVEFNIEYIDSAVALAERHSLLSIVFYGARKNKLALSDEISEKLKRSCFNAIAADSRHSYEMQLIEDAFLKEKIEYMPLKGILLKEIYPSPDMRVSSDTDILIHGEDEEKIKFVMSKLGYNLLSDTHDIHLTFKKDNVIFEMHKKLVSDAAAGADFCNNVWDNAKKTGDYSYRMSKEDTYIYLLIHMAKHIVKGGIGIKHLLDIMLYKNKYFDALDRDYIEKVLREIQLDLFEKKTDNLIKYWFYGGKADEVTECFGDFIIASGNYGTAENHYALMVDKSSESKGKAILKRLFPTYNYMKNLYPRLEKNRGLLTFYWFKRIFSNIKNWERITGEAKAYINVSEDTINKMSELKRNIGL